MMARKEADPYTAFKMLGDVTRKNFIRDLAHDLLGLPGLQEWAKYSGAASSKPRAGEHIAQVWAGHLSQESEISSSREIFEPPSKKRKKESGAVEGQRPQEERPDPQDQGGSL